MARIYQNDSRPINSELAELKKQIEKEDGKFSRRSVGKHETVKNMPKRHGNDVRRTSLNERKVSNASDPDSSSGATIKKKAKDVLPEMIPGKVQPPPTLENMQKGQVLGNGTYATVYIAEDTQTDPHPKESPGVLQKTYVVKDQQFNSKNFKGLTEFKDIIKNEVDVHNFDGNSLSIAQDGFFDEKDGLHHKAIMEYGGIELKEIFDKKIDKKHFLGIGRQFLFQLSLLHQQGIAHKDIKPENILVNHQGRVRLSDFGLAQKREMVNPDDKVFSNPPGTNAVGTQKYIAPEVFGKDAVYSVKADIWSAGVMFYEVLVSGYFPNSNDKISNEDYENMLNTIKTNQNLSESEKSLLLSMLAFNPSERPTAEELLRSPFFQSQEGNDGNHFDLQSQHLLQYQQLAILEKDLEEAEALEQADSSKKALQKVADLKREVLAAGAELKYLQAKMELHDMKTEQKNMQSKLHATEDKISEMKNDIIELEELISTDNEYLQHLEKQLEKNLEWEINSDDIISSIEHQKKLINSSETKKELLQEKINIAEAKLNNEDTKKEKQYLQFRIDLATRDIKLKQIQSQQLGSEADFLRRENKLSNEINQAEPLSDNMKQLQEELATIQQKNEAVKREYEQQAASVIQDYKNNNP